MNTNNVFGLFFGTKYTGKTSLLRELAPINDKPHFICDFSKKFYGEIFTSFQDVIDLELDERKKNGRGISGNRLIVCRFPTLNKSEDYSLLFEFLKLKGNSVLIIDEVQMFIRYNKMPDILYELFTAGRNYDLDFLVATITPIGLDKIIFRQCDFVVCFRIQERSDIEYLSSFSLIGERAFELPNLSSERHEKFVFGNTQNLVIPSTYIPSETSEVEDEEEKTAQLKEIL